MKDYVHFLKQDSFLKNNGPTLASFIVYFRSFQTNIITILQEKYVKNGDPVYGAGIRIHNLRNMSLLP